MNNLEKENEILKKKLEIAQNWIKREILTDFKNIKISKIGLDIENQKNNFFDENIEEIVYSEISWFFDEEIFLHISKDILENILSGEILYYYLNKNKNLDWVGIIISYQKSFDKLIEEQISKPFRKYFNSLKIKPNLENDLIEKNIHSVVFSGYSFSFGKFYNLLKNIKENKDLWNYSQIFSDFLEKYKYLKNILLDESFLNFYEELIDLETFTEKRHIWKVNFSEVLETRKIFLWNLNA